MCQLFGNDRRRTRNLVSSVSSCVVQGMSCEDRRDEYTVDRQLSSRILFGQHRRTRNQRSQLSKVERESDNVVLPSKVIRELNRDQKLFDRLLNNDLQSVEGRHKTFHCLTPDCVRWWFVNDEDKTQLVFCEVNR